MTTNWTVPTIISQYYEPGSENVDIAWDSTNNFLELTTNVYGELQSIGTLYHKARSPKLDLTNKTCFLQATGFNFINLPKTLSGIEVQLTTNRYGRAMDDSINLCLSGNSIGENHAVYDIAPQIIYGSSSDLWTTNLTIENVQDPTFGVIIRFKAHPEWPHNDPVLIKAIEIRIS